MKNETIARISAGILATAAVAGGITVAASTGSAEPAAKPSAADLAIKSPVVERTNTETGLGLDPSNAQQVDMSRAPSGLANASFVLIPSSKGPCLLLVGNREVAPGLSERDSLGCGAGIAPTVSITPGGTIGVVGNKADRVEIVNRDGSKVTAATDSNGVWFAPVGAAEAVVTSGDSVQRVDLSAFSGR